MLAFGPGMWDALKSHQTSYTWGLATYQGAQAVVRCDSGQVEVNGSQQVQASGSVVVSGVGDSLVPRAKSDLLAPYGQELALFRRVSVRSSFWDIPLGVFRIDRSGDTVERFRGDVVLDWSVGVSFSDRLEQIVQDDFLSPEGPVPGSTVWAEIRRLSPIPVQEALGDATVPAATVYQSRIGAVETLLGLLGGVPHVTREGVLTARLQDAWLVDPTPKFEIDAVIEFEDEMLGDFYNQVQVSSSTDASLVAYARIDDDSNPLSVGRAGGRTFKQSAPIYETFAAVQAAANTFRDRLSRRRSRLVSVLCTPEALLLEPGDVGWFRDPVQQRSVLGEVRTQQFPVDPTAGIPVQVMAAEER